MAKLGTLVVELAAKIRTYVADMNEAATATEASATRMERAERTMAQAAKDAATGQADMAETAAQVASRMGPMGGAVAAAAAVVAGYALVSYKAAQENTALVRAMALSGNQAGVTAGQLQGLAGAASQVVGTHGQAVQAIGQMVSGGKVAAENLQALTVTALNAQRTLGLSVADTVARYEELGEAPTKASRKLNEALGYLNAETYRRIQALEDMGKKDEAAALAQLTYAKGVDDATKKVEASLGTLQRTWRSVGEAAGKAWDWMLGLGRKDEVQDQLAGLRQKLEVAERKLSQGFVNTGGGAAVGLRGQYDERRAGLQAEADALREQISLLGRAGATAAQNAAASAQYQKDGIEWADKAAAAEGRLKTNAQKRTEAIDEANKALRDGHVNAVQHAALVADAETRYADKVRRGNDGERERLALLKEHQRGLDDLVKSILEREKAEHAADMAGANGLADAVDRADKAAASAADQLEKQLALNAAMGLSKEAVAELEAAKLEETATSVERLAVQADEVNASGRLGDAYRDQAAALYALAKAKREGAAKQADLDADKDAQRGLKAYEREGLRVAERLEQSLTDSLMRGFESGKSLARNLADTVVNMFKTMVLRPTVQAFVQTGLNAVRLGGSGGVGSSMLGNAASNYATSTIGTAVFGSNAAYGAALGTTSIGGGSQAAMLAAQTGEFGAAGLAATAQAGGGAMASFAAAAPWVLGALAVASILSSMDDSGTLHTGGMASYSATGGLQTSTEHGAFGLGFGGVERGEQTVGMASGLTKSIVGILDATATTFGKTAGYQVATAFADDTSKDGAWGGLLIKGANGQTAVNWNDSRTSRWAPREFADGEAGAKQYALAVAKDVRTVLIEQTPAWADTMLNALGDAPTLEQLAGTVAQIHAAAAAFDTMGRASEQFASLSESALDALVTAMGGAEAAVAGLGSYMGNFYSEEERTGVLRGQLQDKFTDLGLGDLPQTHAQFRAIVESLDLTTASGRAMYAELIKISPAFHTVATASETAATAMANAATEAARAAEQAMEEARQERLRLEEEAAAAATAAMEEANQRVRQFFEAFTGSVEEAANTIGGLSRDIGSYLDGLNANSGTPTQNLASARQAFDQQMALARNGDRTAMGSITQYADRLISAGEQRLGSIQGQQLIAMVKTQLAALPGQISAEQLIVDAIERQTLAHANTLTTNFARLDTNLDGLLTFDELQSAGLATNGEIGNVIAALDANADGQISAMEAMTGTLAAKFAAIDVNVSGAIDFSEFRTAFAGLGSESTLRGIFTTLDADGDGTISRLESIRGSTSTTASNTYGLDKLSRIKDVVNALQWGTAERDAASSTALAVVARQQGWTASDIATAIGRFTGQEIASFFEKYGASIGLGGITPAATAAASPLPGFVIGGSTPAATAAASSSSGFVIGGSTSSINADAARLSSINGYVNTLDWTDGAAKQASTRALYDAAMAYGVTQADISAATGYDLASIQAMFDAVSLPRFATGAAFRNGVVSRPTMFDIGQMGEDGEEAIMPLANIGGSLGVRYAGPDFGAMTREMSGALAAMEARLVEANALLASIQASARATNTHAALSANSLGTIVRDGVAVVGTGENVPVIKVEVVTP